MSPRIRQASWKNRRRSMMNISEFILLLAVVTSLSGGIINLIHGKTILFRKLVGIVMFISLSCITVDTLLLVYYQLQHNYHYSYVYQHTSSRLPALYLVSALWSGQEGSFLLWSAVGSLIGYKFWMEFKKANVKDSLAFSIYTFINTGIIIMTILSKPFKELDYFPLDGTGLNAALQNPWMVIHPPLVFIGYSSMAVIFALCVSAKGGFIKKHQSFSIKKWTLISWLFLSAGILTGSLWAYVALGWGGYWAWDPIENAALVPWLLLAALVHDRENSSNMNVSYKVKYMMPFVLATFGTFLARSGLLKGISVHAYTESSFQLPLLVLISILVIMVFIQVLLKSNGKRFENKDKRFNALKFFRFSSYIFALMVLLGTLMPIFTQKELNTNFFNYSALLFSIVCAILFMSRIFATVPQIAFKSMIASTLALIFIAVLMNFSNFMWLIVLWLYLFPLTAWMINSLNLKSRFFIRKSPNLSAAISHAGVIFLMFGTITSAALSEHGGFIVGKNENYIQVSNSKIEFSDLSRQNSIIVHNAASDILLSPADKSTVSSDPTVSNMVVYETRPLILMFWLGGTLVLFGTFGSIARIICLYHHL
jgi:cytochrome c-type biogenesis protein CcmF